MNQSDKFTETLKVLEEYGVEYILIGGFAVIIYGMPRLTNDIDIIIKMTDENIKKLQNALKSIYDDLSIDLIDENELLSYPVIRYGTPDGFNIDIIARLGEIADYNNIKFEERAINGNKIKIATPESLYFLKTNTMREDDKIDALFLREYIKKLNK